MSAPDFIIRTRLGAPIYTTDSLEKARKEAARLKDEFPGCYLVQVITPPPVERRIWTDRQEREGNVVPMRRAAK